MENPSVRVVVVVCLIVAVSVLKYFVPVESPLLESELLEALEVSMLSDDKVLSPNKNET